MAEEKLEGLIIYREVRDYILTQLRLFQRQQMEGSSFDVSSQTISSKSRDDAVLETLQDIRTILSQKFQNFEDKLNTISKELKDLKRY